VSMLLCLCCSAWESESALSPFTRLPVIPLPVYPFTRLPIYRLSVVPFGPFSRITWMLACVRARSLSSWALTSRRSRS
jgi:hypothetical protein